MKVLFITTHNLVSNPRLVKEVNVAIDEGFEAEVICFIFRNRNFILNNYMMERLTAKGVKFHSIEAGNENKRAWITSTLMEKISRAVAPFLHNNTALLAAAVSRRSFLLAKAIKNVDRADRVVGHNPGALWPTLLAGTRFKCPVGFDVEDYHPGEAHNKHLQDLTRKLMQAVLPKMSYVSFAAPLIMEKVKEDIPFHTGIWEVILNLFPSTEFVNPVPNSVGQPVRFVWFSQNIDHGRGLELILPAITEHREIAELHLFGKVAPAFREKYLEGHKNILLHGELPQIELHKALKNFDVGLALDIAIDENRELVLTNKLLSYLQAGLFVVFTNTAGQRLFMENFPELGRLFDHHSESGERIITEISGVIDALRESQNVRFYTFSTYCWEAESKVFLKLLIGDKTPNACSRK